MATLRNFSESLLNMWKESTPAARIGLLILSLLCAGLVGFVGYWSSQPDFVTLMNEVDPEKMATIIDELDNVGIAYEIGGAGGVLRVDNRKFARARIIAQKNGASTNDLVDDEIGTGGMWLDPTDRKNLETRKKERSLAGTIKIYDAVENAYVHLNEPSKGPFERRLSDPSASVMLSLFPNKKLHDEHVLAIAELVAASVQDLQPEAVKISDKNGRIYSVPDEMAGSINSQSEFTTHKERQLARKAESLLTTFLGYGNASVEVTLDMTFKRSQKELHEVDPDSKVAEEEELTTKRTTEEKLDTLGAGVRANLESGGGTPTGSLETQLDETIRNKYLVDKTIQTQIDNTPVTNFMTVAVLVNEDASAVKQEDGSLIPDIETRIQQLVSNAVGLREDTDKISVVFQKFPPVEPEETVAPFDWNQVNDILRNVSLALAALVALGLGFLTLRKFPRAPSVSPTVKVDTEQAANINQLNDLARNNPEVFARILQSWAGDPDQSNDEDDQTIKRAA